MCSAQVINRIRPGEILRTPMVHDGNKSTVILTLNEVKKC